MEVEGVATTPFTVVLFAVSLAASMQHCQLQQVVGVASRECVAKAGTGTWAGAGAGAEL